MPLSSCLLRAPGLFDEAGGFIFLLRDDFNIDATAPLASPRTCEPGPGTLTLVQNDGQFSVSGGALQIPAQTTPAWGDLYLRGALVTRIAGSVLLAKLNGSTINANGGMGWHSAESGDPDTSELFLNGTTTGVNSLLFLRSQYRGVGGFQIAALAADTEYQMAALLHNLGAAIFIKGGAFTGWTLLWQEVLGSGDVYPFLSNYQNVLADDTFRVARLPGLGSDAVPGNGINVLGCRDLDLCSPGTGSGTSSIASPAAGNTFKHTADCLIRWTHTTVGAALQTDIHARRTDANNTIYLRVAADGSVDLRKTVATTDSSVATAAAGTVTDGEVIDWLLQGITVKAWSNGALIINTTIAEFVSAADGGRVDAIATGGALANLTARTLDGVANVGSANHPGYGLATDVLPGPRATNDTFTHEADCVWEVVVDVLDANSPSISFREETAEQNQWEWYIDSAANDLYLREWIGGAPAVRASFAGPLTNGDRIVTVCEGETIKVYINTTLGFTYATAVNYKTRTTGRVRTVLGTSRASNLIAWPHDLASAPNTPGAAEALTGLTRMAQ